jgi:hypothetical protein
VALLYGVLAYQDWLWLNSHFGNVTDPTRWTPARIAAKFTAALLLMIVGVLGLASGLIGLMFERKALDADKVAEVKKWAFVAGVTGILPGLVFGGLLQIFIWRAHAAESFTMFGLLGSAPAPAPDPSAQPAAPAFDAAAEDAKRKAEYEALFSAPSPAAPPPAYAPPAPAPGYYASAQTQQTDYAYAQAEPQQAAPQPGYAPAPTATGYATQPAGAPICSCGRPMEWVAEYNRYYCYTDDKYEGET